MVIEVESVCLQLCSAKLVPHTYEKIQRINSTTGTSKHQVPSPITREDFQIGSLKPAPYSIDDIWRAIVDHIDRTEYTIEQKEGLSRFKHYGPCRFSEPEILKTYGNFSAFLTTPSSTAFLTGFCSLEPIARHIFASDMR
jgi:hypothetical protein